MSLAYVKNGRMDSIKCPENQAYTIVKEG